MAHPTYAMQVIISFLGIFSLFLLSCKTIPVPEHSPQINLSNIEMVPIEGSKVRMIPVKRNKQGEYYLEMFLKYENSGLNIIEGIKSGEIWNHWIVVFDSEGNEIGREPINFQAFQIKTIETTTVEKDQEFVVSKDGSIFGKETKEKTNVISKLDPNIRHKIYTDKDLVPQIIKLKKIPPQGSFVSIIVELTYVAPFLDELCDEDSDTKCPEIRTRVFQKIQNRNQLELKRLEDAIREKITSGSPKELESIRDKELKFQSITSANDPSRKPGNYGSDISYCDSIEECRAGMIDEIQKINSKNRSFPYLKMAEPDKEGYMKFKSWIGYLRPFFDQSVTYDGSRVYYREWNLVSIPRFFQIRTIEGSPLKTVEEDEVIEIQPKQKNNQYPTQIPIKPEY